MIKLKPVFYLVRATFKTSLLWRSIIISDKNLIWDSIGIKLNNLVRNEIWLEINDQIKINKK